MIPLTVAQAAAQIMAGELGLAEDIMIGNLMISALRNVEPNLELNVTERAIQAGFDMTIAAREIPTVVNIDICLANPELSVEGGIDAALSGGFEGLFLTWYDKRDELYRMFKEREIIDFQTHDQLYEDYLVQRIVPYADANENWDAFFANVTLRKVKINNDLLIMGVLPELLPWIPGGAL